MMNNLRVSPTVGLILFALLCTALYGWGYNLFELVVGCANFTPTSNWAMLLLRGVGVFVFPVGAFLGLLF